MRISWTSQETTDAGLTTVAEHILDFDAVVSEIHEGSSVLTEHAVESGAPLTDHKRANPDRVTIEAIVTNTPLDAPPSSGFDTGPRVVASVKKRDDLQAQVVVFSAEFDRIQEVVNTLRRLRLEAVGVTMSSSLWTYEDMQITGVKVPRSPQDGDSITIVIDAQAVRVAESRTVAAPQPREPRASRRRDRGGQETAEGSTAERSQTSTLQRAREEYEAQRAAGATRSDAALTAVRSAFGG